MADQEIPRTFCIHRDGVDAGARCKLHRTPQAPTEAEMEQMKEADGPFDKTVANAIGNHEQGLNKI